MLTRQQDNIRASRPQYRPPNYIIARAANFIRSAIKEPIRLYNNCIATRLLIKKKMIVYVVGTCAALTLLGISIINAEVRIYILYPTVVYIIYRVIDHLVERLRKSRNL
jgi:hypothetical protein